MIRILFDLEKEYITQINVFYSKGFLDYYFGNVLSSSITKNFICGEVLENSCSGVIPEQANCLDRLDNLPAAEGSQLNVDGNSLGCRALHGAFAFANPLNHCAHVALNPTEDPKGRFRCQTSDNMDIDTLFSQADLDFHARNAKKLGFDVEIGFRDF